MAVPLSSTGPCDADFGAFRDERGDSNYILSPSKALEASAAR
jgi:hypothetical protein